MKVDIGNMSTKKEGHNSHLSPRVGLWWANMHISNISNFTGLRKVTSTPHSVQSIGNGVFMVRFRKLPI